MKSKKRWELSRSRKESYVERLSLKLPALRGQANISQEDLANIIGISRQTYYGIENRKKDMSWNTYIALTFFFDSVEETSQMLRELEAFPTDLVAQFNTITQIEEN